MIHSARVAGLLGVGLALGQAPTAPVAIPPKPMAFDVASIRRHNGPVDPTQKSGVTPEGYRLRNMSLMLLILTAYVPQSDGVEFFLLDDSVSGEPPWAESERYDVDAKIGESDRVAWQNPATQKPMLQAMLRDLLTERCKLVVHRETKEGTVYFLRVGKSGPKFKETDPAVEHLGASMPLGGVVAPEKDGLHVFDASMGLVASMLSGFLRADHPVIDRTELKGRYDVLLVRGPIFVSPSDTPHDGMTASDPGASIFSRVEQLGLKLEPGKAPIEKLVIDNMGRPSEN